MVTELLDQQKMLSLANSPSEEALIEELRGTPYRYSIENLDLGASAIDYEKAFYNVFLERLNKVVKVSPQGFESILMTYFPVRLEIINIKRILRGKYAGQSREEIERILLPVAPYSIRNIDDLLKADDVEGVVNALRGTIYATLSDFLPFFREQGSLWALEVELNYIYFDAIEAAISKAISKYRDLLIKLVEVDQSVEIILLALSIPSGTETLGTALESILDRSRLVSAETFRQLMSREDLTSTLSRLKGPILDILSPLSENDSAMVRTKLQRYLLETVGRVARTDAMDFPYVLWFLMRCEAEVKDMARIAWCQDQNLSYKQFSRYFLLL